MLRVTFAAIPSLLPRTSSRHPTLLEESVQIREDITRVKKLARIVTEPAAKRHGKNPLREGRIREDRIG